MLWKPWIKINGLISVTFNFFFSKVFVDSFKLQENCFNCTHQIYQSIKFLSPLSSLWLHMSEMNAVSFHIICNHPRDFVWFSFHYHKYIGMIMHMCAECMFLPVCACVCNVIIFSTYEGIGLWKIWSQIFKLYFCSKHSSVFALNYRCFLWAR